MSRRRDLDFAHDHGWTVSPTAGGHLRLEHPSGGLVFTSSTPGDCRAEANNIAQLRRAMRATRGATRCSQAEHERGTT